MPMPANRFVIARATPLLLMSTLTLTLGACAGGTPPGGAPPVDIGARDGRLADCPDSPNCVSSRATDPERRVAPLDYAGDAEAAWQRARDAVAGLPRTRIVTAEADYLHAEARSRWLGFVDDLELLHEPAASTIQVRSASRSGHYDFGVNRERVERLRALLQEDDTQ